MAEYVVLAIDTQRALDSIIDYMAHFRKGAAVGCAWVRSAQISGLAVTDPATAQNLCSSYVGDVRALSPAEGVAVLYEEARGEYLHGRQSPDGPGPYVQAGPRYRRVLSLLSRLDRGLAGRVRAEWDAHAGETWRHRAAAAERTDALLNGTVERAGR